MGFVNRMLEEEERREYVFDSSRCHYKFRDKKIRFEGGTIDDENNVRLFIYADAMPCGPDYRDLRDRDIKYGLLDYKGEVFYFEARRTIPKGNDLHWSFDNESWREELDEEKLEYLREALKVYQYNGYDPYGIKRKEKDPTYHMLNEGVRVFIDF